MALQRIPIQKLGHVAFRVKDPDASSAYYQRVLGLRETVRSGSSVALASGGLYSDQSPVELVLTRGEETALDYICFEAAGEDELEACRAALVSRGIDVERKAENELHGAAIVYTGARGYRFMIQVGRRDASLEPAALWPYRITKLGHVTLKTPDPVELKQFFEEKMDLRLSEQMGDRFFWYRCNPDHHTIACCYSPVQGVQHIAFELASWDDVMRFNDHLQREGVRIEYGPGRHGPGNNIFIYFVDPNGIRFELYCDMHKIYNEGDYVPKVWDASQRMSNVNRWGPQPPESFLD